MGPLAGIKVIELAGIGPGPMCAMLLAEMGADVLRIDRAAGTDLGMPVDPKYDLLGRGRRSAAIELKKKEGVDALMRMVDEADVLIEGFRPGVAERLGIGPDECLARNPRLVYGRMTGWGQDGPLAQAAGHDIDYIALIGALHSIGRRDERPVPPLNLVGDFGGGALYLVVGLLAALLERERSGRGQIVDAAMVDGAASLMTIVYGLHAAGIWEDRRGANLLDTGAPFYDAYETKDGKYVALGAIEPKFFAELLERTGLDREELPSQFDREAWPAVKERFAQLFRTKTRDEWSKLLEGTDACFAPVLSLEEAPQHPHNRHRGTFVEVEGVVQPGPAPRFSRTPTKIPRRASAPGEHTDEALRDWGFSDPDISRLRASGAIR